MVKNNLMSEPQAVAETFNDYFSSIANKLQSKIHHFGNDFSYFLKNENPNKKEIPLLGLASSLLIPIDPLVSP